MALKVGGMSKQLLLEGKLSPATGPITTGTILELWKFSKSSGLPNAKFLLWVSQLSGEAFLSSQNAAILSKVCRVEQKLSKIRGKKLEEAKEEPFIFEKNAPLKQKQKQSQQSPTKDNIDHQISSDLNVSKKGPISLHSSPVKTRRLSHHIVRLGDRRLGLYLRRAHLTHLKTSQKLSEGRQKVASLLELNKQAKRKHETLKQRHSKALDEIENLKKSAKRVKLAVQEDQQTLKDKISRPLAQKVTSLQDRCKRLMVVGIRDQRKMKMLTSENDFLKNRKRETLQAKLEGLEQQVDNLKAVNSYLKQSVDYLSTLIHDGKNVDLYDETSKKFTTDTVQSI